MLRRGEREPEWSDATVISDLLLTSARGLPPPRLHPRTMRKKKFPKRTPEEKAHSLEVRARALKRLEELKRRDIERAAGRRASS